MKILLFGKNGQVGWELQRALLPLGELIALDRQGGNGLCGDLSDLYGLASTIDQVKPDVIVNAAAYTAVDKAESEPGLAHLINAEASAALADAADACGAWLIHYSTDYVFNGSGEQAWLETDDTAPLNIYGSTKLEGEQLIQQSGCKHIILRTSWVYAARGNNFAKTMLRLAGERDTLSVINDQFGAPTGAELLADVCAHIIRQASNNESVSAVYHLAADGVCTWYDYARFVLAYAAQKGRQLKVPADAVTPIATSAYPTPAQRPHNSRLNTTKLKTTFGLSLPHWQIGVTRMLDEIL